MSGNAVPQELVGGSGERRAKTSPGMCTEEEFFKEKSKHFKKILYKLLRNQAVVQLISNSCEETGKELHISKREKFVNNACMHVSGP